MADFSLDAAVAEWRSSVAAQRAIAPADVDELEAHLRERIDALTGSGLADDEAFLIALKRLGAVDDLSQEYAREHTERLWKQLVGAPARPSGSSGLALALGFAFLAGILVKIPTLFDAPGGDQFFGGGPAAFSASISLVLACLAGYFAVVRRAPLLGVVAAAVGFVAITTANLVYPFVAGGMTEMLAVVHTPIALWLLLGIVFAAGAWRSAATRMDFIRFTGEWAVYYALIALGGAVLVALTIALFSAIGVDAARFAQDWMIPCGAAGAVLVAAWLVEAKQAVIENIAPVLTRAFTPLFTALMVALIVVGLLQGGLGEVDRNLLILFDITLLIVLGLVLYAMSARDPLAPPSWFERLQLVLLATAVAVDLIVLVAMLTRIGEFGLTANKAASLGLNVILLVNLVVAIVLQTRFVVGRTPFATLERWQTAYLPVYLAWAVVVVLVFPPLFTYA
ncbi:MAG TPA: permease prefix domain 1-containing protein [Agromyces sp.]